jgi:hypothetical protein
MKSMETDMKSLVTYEKFGDKKFGDRYEKFGDMKSMETDMKSLVTDTKSLET